ncbi:MAG TPA: hypothetical protein VFI29_06405 [Hanamia sp.]|nr:hypothetical protein [Hanamia sp.]
MKTLIKDYGLRFYVRDMYIKNAGKRGGEIFRPFHKKDVKPFQIRIKYAIDGAQKVIRRIDEKNPLCKN